MSTPLSKSFRSHPLERGSPPSWACEWGEDRFGVFVGFRVGEVRQRMRWIPPGTFRMGSPETEDARWDREGPQHDVRLKQGFWLGDTPVTQALWEAVTGENPSEFRSPDRPVERVSWRDGLEFFDRLGVVAPGLEPRYPTEAEWEYACRAGSTTSTYVGELEIIGANDGPMLDEIAWYGGNSGVDFDLENGVDSSSWNEKQHDHLSAGTRAVRAKEANLWGLFDMLGNVYEWCADVKDDYTSDPRVDPIVDAEVDSARSRVIRGGSWYSRARDVRAAYRRWLDADGCWLSLGLRLARGSHPAERRESGSAGR